LTQKAKEREQFKHLNDASNSNSIISLLSTAQDKFQETVGFFKIVQRFIVQNSLLFRNENQKQQIIQKQQRRVCHLYL